MAGCYWQWLDEGGCYSGTYAYADAGGQGQQYLPDFKMLSGGRWDYASYSGARTRYSAYSRASVSAGYSSRGGADGQAVI
jgi:hypothetical protein